MWVPQRNLWSAREKGRFSALTLLGSEELTEISEIRRKPQWPLKIPRKRLPEATPSQIVESTSS